MSKVSAPQLNPRDIIAKKYEVDALLGVGPQGPTYLVRDMANGRKMALKLLAGPPASDEVAQEVLRRSQALAHDGIVRLTDTGVWDEPGTRTQYRWVTMDYIEGDSLRRLMDSYAGQKQVFAVPEAAQILVKTLEAVAFAHRPDGFIHRHLKPTNVIVQTRMVGGKPVRSVRIVGFGISDLIAEEVLQRATTTPYHARENLDPHGTSTTLDTYSAGIIFYELLCGQPPRGTYLPPSHVRNLGEPPLPSRIDAIVFVATNFSPDNRYPSAQNMLVDIQRAVTELGGVQTGVSMKVVVGSVAASILVLAGIGVKLWSGDGAEAREDEALRQAVVAATPAHSADEVKQRLAGRANMVWVPGGEFVKGRLRTESAENVALSEPLAARTQVPGFFIDMFEWPNQPGTYPKVNVTVQDAETFCGSVGKRLCTEDEWEKACKGPNNTSYAFDVPPAADGAVGADRFDATVCGDVAADANGDGAADRASGSSEKCRSGYGAFDLSGGASEWTATGGASAKFRRIKGGKRGEAARASRCSAFDERRADLPEASLSFRCCLDENAPAAAQAPSPEGAAPASAGAAPPSKAP